MTRLKHMLLLAIACITMMAAVPVAQSQIVVVRRPYRHPHRRYHRHYHRGPYHRFPR